MEPARVENPLTRSQREAVAARGNVLVMAGAGTGKTRTLVARCLDCLRRERVALDEILVVTFTEAAAAEMKQRLRRALENESASHPGDSHQAAQLALFDAAHIGTLHGFCLKLVREHFYELGLDPQLAVADEGQARLLAAETLEEALQARYAGEDELSAAVRELIQIYGGGRDRKIRDLVLRLHHRAQTRPDADGWLARQVETFSKSHPVEWRAWLDDAIRAWRGEWLPVLETLRTENPKAAECLESLQKWRSASAPGADNVRREGAPNGTRGACAPLLSPEAAAEVLAQVLAADTGWPARRKTALRKPLEDFFDEVAFLHSLMPTPADDPLAEDWGWVRPHMDALLRLTRDFAARFAARKRDEGLLDFHDLEQFALKLLWNFDTDGPTPVAARWREKFRFVFVDEYQDINAAQDKIIQALGREGADANRFLVGDVKQSIYRFRLAEPGIFRAYAKSWRGENGRAIPLTDNFRSRERLLDFVNSVFGVLMREDLGGVDYDATARLTHGSPEKRRLLSATENPTPRAELLLRLKTRRAGGNDGAANESGADALADLLDADREARLLARRLKDLHDSGHDIWDEEREQFRPAAWRDLAVLLRSPSGKAEIYAREFARAGVPLTVERGGFYDSGEVLDLLSLLQLLDNPLQDVPVLAVLRSPLVGLSLDDLAQIRLAANGHFWFALNQVRDPKSEVQSGARAKVETFLEQFSRWRALARQVALSPCLEAVLAETQYAEWLESRPRGRQRRANVGQFLNLAQQFDQFQRQGLFRFLNFVQARREAEVEPEVAPVAEEDAVRLMSIHQSKGLEFPVVALADLAKPFNEQDLRGDVILDEALGLCPRVQPPKDGGRYPSLPHWLAQKHQRRELRSEELRLLYVAVTRARDTLILAGSVSQKKWETLWSQPGIAASRDVQAANSFADWLGLWFRGQCSESGNPIATEGKLPHLLWRVAEDAESGDDSTRGSRDDEAQTPSGSFHVVSETNAIEMDDATAERLRAMLSWTYPHETATRRAAKASVTVLRRQAEELEDEVEPVFSVFTSGSSARRRASPTKTPDSQLRTPKLSAAEAGTAAHKFLRHLAMEMAAGVPALAAEAERLERENVLSPDERAALDLEGLAAFWNSEIGSRIRTHAADVKRELAFTARFTPAELDDLLGTRSGAGLEGEFIVVQGAADLAVLLEDRIWLVDFKTDDIGADGLAEKVRIYSPQLRLYARALEKIHARPVANAWLHFLAARRTVEI
ncbi:MAG: helicase-exonuclease AddAB subunit AddA [Verrucomicrobiota bacterium]|nr:helicase-exonuclease AddAB subunit AddA [Verrucomicrobiota bacterium]